MSIVRVFLFVFLILILLLVANQMLDEKSAFDSGFNDNLTNSSQENTSDENDLMSTREETPDEDKKGWWKHTGHSTVTAGTTEEKGDESFDDKKEDNPEIPEFPGLVSPVAITIGIFMLLRRK